MTRHLAEKTGVDDSLPHRSLGTLPTPVEWFKKLGERIGIEELYVKRDDLTGDRYGGNKVRKLEYLLADAAARDRTQVWTGGAIGSNHVLATSIYARACSLEPCAVQFPQPVTAHVRDNLRALSTTQPTLKLVDSEVRALLEAVKLKARARLSRSPSFYYIPPGGAGPIGEIGYVEAALELRQQIKAGLCPEPNVIFVPVGTGGTLAGLVLGCRLASLDVDIVGVRVGPRTFGNAWRVARLARKTASLLRSHGLTQTPSIGRDDITILHRYVGGGYGVETTAARSSIEMAESYGLDLDETYTAKTFAACIGEFDRRELADKTVLYWHTYNGVDLSHRIEQAAAAQNLPPEYVSFLE